MTAQCAACMGGIAKGDKFVIAGTEVFHRGCLANARNSLASRQQARIGELERLIAQLKEDAFDAARLRTSIDDANRDARNVRAERDRLARELAHANAIKDGLRTSLTNAGYDVERRETERVRLRRELDESIAERNRLADELRAARETRAEIAKSNEGLDDTQIRFGLLELDLD